MGFFSEIRKLLFAKKSVAKSGMEKIKDETSEKIDELVDSGRQLRDRAEEKLDNLVDAFTQDDPVDTSTPTHEDTPAVSVEETIQQSEPTPTESSFVEKVGKKTIEKTEELGEKVLEGAEEAGKKLGDLAERVGEKVHSGAEELKEKAKDAIEYLDKKLDETVEKAKDLDAELNKNDQDGDGFADEPADLSGSLLDGKDDFFEKAKRFSEGQPLDDSPKLSTNKAETEKPSYKAYGMEDADGDGNELIDDAIIEEE